MQTYHKQAFYYFYRPKNASFLTCVVYQPLNSNHSSEIHWPRASELKNFTKFISQLSHLEVFVKTNKKTHRP